MILWGVTLIALYGTWLNAQGKKNGFILWILSNTTFAIWNFMIGEYPQSFLFLCYLFLAVYGYISWKKKENKECSEI